MGREAGRVGAVPTFMPMSDWITDRPPTEADADDDGDVKVCTSPRLNPEDYVYENWNIVTPGWPWQHSPYCARTPVAPEPTPAAPESEPELQHEIPEPIRSSATPFFVLMLSQPYGRVVQAHSTLHEALEQQACLDSRLGTTHIAECRIIPELTREVPADDT